MRTLGLSAALAIMTATGLVSVSRTAIAAAVELTFEGLAHQENVANYYNGGYGGSGSGPGPNDGITFTGDPAINNFLAVPEAVVSVAAGGNGYFTNAPSGVTILSIESSGPFNAIILNDASGFSSQLSFDYFSLEPASPGYASTYSGINGTGSLLGSVPLVDTPQPTHGPISYFQPVTLPFSGTAMSVVFGADPRVGIGFDNIVLGSDAIVTPPSDVPEPNSVLLLGLGLFTLLALRRRRA